MKNDTIVIWTVDGKAGENVFTTRSDARNEKRTRRTAGDTTALMYRVQAKLIDRAVAR